MVGRADVGACLFFLASWLSYHHGCSNHVITTRWLWVLLSMVFATFSMLTKEQGITVIGVCLLYDVIVVSRIRMKDFYLSMKKVEPIACTVQGNNTIKQQTTNIPFKTAKTNYLNNTKHTNSDSFI